MSTLEQQIEEAFIETLRGLKYDYREDIRDRVSLEKNFREKFQALNRVHLTDSEYSRLLDGIIFLPVYEFADEANTKITHLDDFAARFLQKCALGTTLSRYMVLVSSEQKLMVMRPYQVYAVQQIVKCIEDDAGNGYIWHTTGSGKTLTSFKASTLLKLNERIHTRLINILSHGNYSLYEPQEMLEENKNYFRKILRDFINRYPFNPALFPDPASPPERTTP